MTKQMLILFSMLVLIVASTGCGSKEESKGPETPRSEVPDVPDSLRLMMDSLSAIHYPVRDAQNSFVTLQTTFGNMTVELYRDVAPAHADSFLARSTEGFYDSLIFFRVIDKFMIQGGDPKNNGTGNAGYYLNAEFNELPHQSGTLSMARSRDPNSASSQFFVCLARNRMTQSLDNKYTVFGQLIVGYDVLHSIGAGEVGPNPLDETETSSPVKPVMIIKAYASDAEGQPI
jgi:cyclophilin family peptidyl-prolyl cis-trans isomerase